MDLSVTPSSGTKDRDPRRSTWGSEDRRRARLNFGVGHVQCMDCHSWFVSELAHDAHWWSWQGTMICLTVEAMEDSGMTQDDEGVWTITPHSSTWDLG